MAIAALLALALFAQEPAAAPVEGPVPPGAPEDDYGLVAWCHGALTGHMDLYGAVKPELDKLSSDPSKAELDSQQMAAGREYLELYARALYAAERASPTVLTTRGEQARAKGAGIWGPAINATDPKTRMWSWLMWELPGRCETAARRLEERSLLAAPALAASAEPVVSEQDRQAATDAAALLSGEPEPTPPQ